MIIFQNQEEFLSKRLDDINNEKCKRKKIEKTLNTRNVICILVKRCMSEEKIKSSQDINQDVIQLSQEQLSEEQIRELVKKAWEEGKPEANLILILSEWRRPGPAFNDFSRIDILYGEVEQVLLEHNYNYPTTDEYVYAFIPKTRTVIILTEWGDNYQGKMQKHMKLYLFTYPKGWKSIYLY